MNNFFYTHFIKPRFSDEDSARREFILNILLLGSIVLATSAFLIVLIDSVRAGSNFQGAPPWTMLLALSFFLALYGLSRKGYFKLVAYIFITLYLVLGIYSLYTWGILLAQGLLVFVLVIVIASVLINTRFAFWMTILISLILIWLTGIETTHQHLPNLHWMQEPLGDDLIALLFTFGVIMVVSWLSNREIERSLARARRSEAALKKERDLLEVRVEERTEELKQSQREQILQLSKFAEFGRLASGVFHDLVNPLMTVSLNLEKLGSDKDKSQRLERAIEGTHRMVRYIESARKQVQNQRELSTFSLNQEIQQAIDIVTYKARKQNVAITLEAPAEIKTFGDSVKFHQLITNLLSNAIDAYEAITRENNRAVLIDLKCEDEQIILKVQDWASGISKENLPKLFEPFFTTKSTDKGTGLGLPIVKETVEKEFKGSIKVVSEEHKGSTFTVTFPVQKESHDHVNQSPKDNKAKP